MPISDYCSKEVVTIPPTEPIDTAARLMLDHNVGCLVVVEAHKPIGILTDRDILRTVVAEHRSAEVTYVDEVMSRKLLKVPQDTGVFEGTQILCEEGIRRLPVVDKQGNLAGIITLDDLLILMGTELINLASVSVNERNRESE